MQNKQTNFGWILIAIITIAPIALWLMAPAYPSRFTNFETTLANLGQIFGLVGTVLLSLNFILSTRFKSLEKYFKGLNDVYIKHELFGKIAFALLLFHPLLLITKYTSGSLVEAIKFLLPGDNWNINYGVLSLGVMLILIVLTLYLRPRYDFWKITHKFFGLALILAGLHIYLIPSDVSTYLPLRVYILILIALGVLAYTYKTLLGWILVPKIVFEVVDVKAVNSMVTEISLKTKNAFDYKAGQFCFVSFDDDTVGNESHPFSFVSAPHEKEVRIAVKKLGDYTKIMPKLKKGSIAKIEGPFGIFNYENARYQKQVWIAGGIGITPFVSMAEDLINQKADYDIDLFYSIRKMEDAAFLSKLKDLATKIRSKFRVHLYCYEERGLLTAEIVSKATNGLSDKDIFICGPPSIMKILKEQCANMKVDESLIHTEEFSF